MNILCIGDIVGKPGRLAVHGLFHSLKKDLDLDVVIANAENAAGGAGITSRIARSFFHIGVDVLTLGFAKPKHLYNFNFKHTASA